MNADSPLESLREAVAGDLKPVKPLHPAWMRIMLAVGFTTVVLAFILAKASLRADLDQLPMWLSWGCATLQFALGLVLVALALKEAVPGAGAPAGAVAVAAVTAVTVQVLVGVATSLVSPTIASGVGFAAGIGCFAHETTMALPAFAITLSLVFRALPLRAPTAGLLGGAGATVTADAVIHLLCPVSSLSHVLVWHTGAVIFFMTVGWLAGIVWQHLRWSNGS